MNLDTLVCGGRLPWQPSREVHDLDVWHRYDHPIAGTYWQHGKQVLFTLIGDTSSSLSVWAYVPVSAADAAKMDGAEFDSPTDMRHFIEGIFADKEAAFALAKDLKIWRWTRRRVPSDSGLLQAATASLAEMVRAIRDKHLPQPPDLLFQAELAQAEVTTDDLVDA